MLKVHSEIGKQLDSLADLVTFGVAPGFIMFHEIQSAFTLSGFFQDGINFGSRSYNLEYLALLIPVFSAIRLAKFNIDLRQTNSFIGLPTPANALLISSIPCIFLQTFDPLCSTCEPYLLLITLRNPAFLISLTILLSYILVAELPLFALKFKNYSWAENKVRYIFLGLSFIFLILFYFIAIPIIIFMYIILSVILTLIKNRPLSSTSSN